MVSFRRTEKRDPFEEDEISLAEEPAAHAAAHAAVCVDRARRDGFDCSAN